MAAFSGKLMLNQTNKKGGKTISTIAKCYSLNHTSETKRNTVKRYSIACDKGGSHAQQSESLSLSWAGWSLIVAVMMMFGVVQEGERVRLQNKIIKSIAQQILQTETNPKHYE